MAEAFESLPHAVKVVAFALLVLLVLIVMCALRRDMAECKQIQRDAEQDGRDIEKLLAAIHAHARPGEIRSVKGTTYKA